ncbi:hypothetical protein SLEP1_g24608 [Rubroshorea leprosula]|uniref:Transposase n=1 Tax=Rubroshorea leprosula TaxID=152421 RepID=A0AAV5JJC1_9ROSI|nr:hypothetical protein SLEP1_g24608 [Rubroshorea leprosula]
MEYVKKCDIVDDYDEDQYDFESYEKLVQFFYVGFDSDNDELEVLGSRNQIQKELEVPVEIVDNDTTNKDICTATKSVNKQKGLGRKDRKRNNTKRKKLPNLVGNDLFFINSRTDVGSGESKYFDSDDPGEFEGNYFEEYATLLGYNDVLAGKKSKKHHFMLTTIVVDSESNETCGWFLYHLKKDLKLQNGSNLTIVLDQHKVCL